MNAYWTKVREVYSTQRNVWRYGQTCFNVLHILHPEIADEIRGTHLDPFNWVDTDFRKPHWMDFQHYILVTLG